MNPGNCALVITSSVYVNAPYTVLTDPGEREMQYMDSLSFFIKESPLERIIVCDNSGYSYTDQLYGLAASHGKQIELLSFKGDNELVAQYGKGYGEGEIMQYVLANSRLLKEVDGFLKVTGRLKLINIARLLRQMDQRDNYFMPVSLLRPRFMVPRAARACLDVRVYYTTKAFFRAVLLTAYKTVRDHEVYFLEHAYYKAVASSGVKVKCLPVAPEITGVSGSNGWIIKERSFPKKLLIRLVALLGYVKPV